ncbi:MAG: DUF1049 domain-containing protein [Firmicutes bacterium]|nr:DUF1049 domain-containing protein [Bacillota bacterium]
MQFLMILVLFFSLVVAVFAVQNAVLVPVNFITWHFETSLVFVILVATALGAVIVGLLGLFTGIKQRWKIKGLDNTNSKLSQEVDRLTGQNEELKAAVNQLEEKLREAKEIFSLQLASGDSEKAVQLKKELSGAEFVVWDEPLTRVRLAAGDADRVREALGDCAGFYQLTVTGSETSLVVNADYWQTVETQYPDAEMDGPWRGILLRQEAALPVADAFFSLLVTRLSESVPSYAVTTIHSQYLLLVKEDDLATAVQKLQVILDMI